jgi:hypothetical protein
MVSFRIHDSHNFAIHDDMKIVQISGRGKSRKSAVKSFESITNQLTKWSSSLIN